MLVESFIEIDCVMCDFHTLKYLGSEMVAPQGSAGAGSEMVPVPL